MFKTVPLLLALPILAACSSASPYMKASQPGPAPGDNESLVVFCRPARLTGAVVNFDVWDGLKLIGFSEKGSFFEYRCAPGTHLFLARGESAKAIDAELEGGKTYYVWVTPRMGLLYAAVGFTPVNKGSNLEPTVWKALLKSKCRELVPEAAAPYEKGQQQAIRKLVEEFERQREDVLLLRPEDGQSREASEVTRFRSGKGREKVVEP